MTRPMNEHQFGNWTVLFSYGRPVAACHPDKGYFRTEKFHTYATTNQINRWLYEYEGPNCPVDERPQKFFDKFVEEELNG